MNKPERVLCKRSMIIGDPFYYDDNDNKIEKDNRMLVEGEWYDVVCNENDTEETFSIIDNQGSLHLFYIYEDDTNHNLPRTYAKWFYTPGELEKKQTRQETKLTEMQRMQIKYGVIFGDRCPDCGSRLKPENNGGVCCVKCDYWFCF